MLLKPAFRALTPFVLLFFGKQFVNRTSRKFQVSFQLLNLRKYIGQIRFDARIREANLLKSQFLTSSVDMGPKTSKGKKSKAAESGSGTTEETSKPTRSTRGRADKVKADNDESKMKPVSKKTKVLHTIEEEIMETGLPKVSQDDTGSDSSEKTSSKKKGKPAKGKNKMEEKQPEETNAAKHAVSDDDDSEADTSEPSKPIASPPKKRGRQAASETSEEPSNKKAKLEDSKGDSKPKLNQTSSNYADMKLDSTAETKEGKKWNFKISSWNVAGLKAWIKKAGLDFIKNEKPDIICLQETKCSEDDLPPGAKVSGYHSYWLSGEKKGYAGVALLSKEKPIKVDYGIGNKDFDCDGRIITAEYEKFFLVAVYVPNAGQKLKNLDRRMEWDPLLRAHIKKLDEKKPVVLCGDMNVSHTEIDLANPKTNTKNAGFTQEERDGLTVLLKEGFVDTFRHLYPEKTGAYTFWTYMNNARSRNTGWRLDYFILSERFVPSVCDNVMRNAVYGSDHCPITLFLHI